VEFSGEPIYIYCVQKIGGRYEVYDLRTLTRIGFSSTWMMGAPIIVHENLDAAIMFATLRL
jgi:hypothetical protein